jgi:hypothetical protein
MSFPATHFLDGKVFAWVCHANTLQFTRKAQLTAERYAKADT